MAWAETGWAGMTVLVRTGLAWVGAAWVGCSGLLGFSRGAFQGCVFASYYSGRVFEACKGGGDSLYQTPKHANANEFSIL